MFKLISMAIIKIAIAVASFLGGITLLSQAVNGGAYFILSGLAAMGAGLFCIAAVLEEDVWLIRGTIREKKLRRSL